tara:strand:- start:41620 stop:42096 length:477 start_codon:yes stop_codon:yes gene_type:complete
MTQETIENVRSEKEIIKAKITTLGTSGLLNRSGVFVGISGATKLSRSVLLNADISINIRKAALNSFNPLIGLGVGYECAKKRTKFSFAPGIKLQLSSLRLNDASNIYNSDALIGYSMAIGDRFRFIQSLYAGVGHEDSPNFNLFYASYLIQIGVGYRF